MLLFCLCGFNSQGAQDYDKYLEDINNLSKCQVLVVTLTVIKHSLMSTVQRLLMKCVGIRKLVVSLGYTSVRTRI